MARLGPPVSVEVRLLAEATATLPAHVGLLARMGPLVSEEGGLEAKATPTLTTHAWLLC